MAEETTAAEAVTTETKTEPAATATLPPDVEAAIKNMGASNIEEVIEMARQYAEAGTPEGTKRIVANVAAKYGVDIAKAMLAKDPDAVLKDVDKDVRRKVRRSVARRDGTETVESEDLESDAPTPAEEARAAQAAAREASEQARQAQASARVTAQAVSVAPSLLALAQKDSRIASNFSQHTDEVSALITSGHPKYQGANGVKNASDDVIARWESYGAMAGLTRPTPATPAKGADLPVPTAEDAQKVVNEALEESRGQGSGSFIDSLMRRAKLG